jgi:uncharacterized membrane protein YecN with MAPEG domain
MHILPTYAALLGLFFIFLSVRTLLLRKKLQIGVGDGGDKQMLRAMRVHANFAEYVPLSLVLIGFVEAGGAPSLAIHLLAGAILFGRVLHAYGVSQQRENLKFRVIGMALNLSSIIIASLFLLFQAFPKL